MELKIGQANKRQTRAPTATSKRSKKLIMSSLESPLKRPSSIKKKSTPLTERKEHRINQIWHNDDHHHHDHHHHYQVDRLIGLPGATISVSDSLCEGGPTSSSLLSSPLLKPNYANRAPGCSFSTIMQFHHHHLYHHHHHPCLHKYHHFHQNHYHLRHRLQLHPKSQECQQEQQIEIEEQTRLNPLHSHHQLGHHQQQTITSKHQKLQLNQEHHSQNYNISTTNYSIYYIVKILIFLNLLLNFNQLPLNISQQQQQYQPILKRPHERYTNHLLLFALADKTSSSSSNSNTLTSNQLEVDVELSTTSSRGWPKETIGSFSTDNKPLDFVLHDEGSEGQNKHHHHHRRHRHHHHHHQQQHHHQINIQANGQQEPRARRHYHNYHTRGNRDNNNNYFDPSGADRPVVATKKGLVRGITQKLSTGKSVDAFLGVPFAQPPVGRYRFRHPQPINPWQGELDASRLPNSCFQINDTFFGADFAGTKIWNPNTPLNEDCLYLNIWTPFAVANTTVGTSGHTSTSTGTNNKQTNGQHQQQPTVERLAAASAANNNPKRPVLVWIFGGGFYSGTSSLALYEGGLLASEEDIILVSLNYRVSSLGFLYFGRPDAPGNAGLFDQLMALQWVNDNIDQFGGDPNRVTIFGESAGAVSISFHLLSPLSRNLFSQAILQSGAATCPWGLMDNNEIITNGLELASLVNCPSNQSDLGAVMECLLKADPMALVSQEITRTRSVLDFPFVPVIDGSFLIESPAETLSKGNFKPARLLLGSNNDEGGAFLIYLSEFSQCPASSSASSSSSSSLTSSSSSLASASHSAPPAASPFDSMMLDSMATTSDNQQPQPGGTTSGGPAVFMGSELRDQANDPIDSLDLLATSRQQQHHHQQHSPSERSSSSSPAGAGSHQQYQQQNDSKPCKPMDMLSLTRDDFERILKEGLNPYADHAMGREAIMYEYSNWNTPHEPLASYDGLDKIVGDYYFTCHVNEFGQHYAQAGNPVYMYLFKQRTSISAWPRWLGVLHGDEINYIFGEPLNQMYNYSAKEVELSRRMMKYWANFAKFGENTSMAERWPDYGDKRQYFELHADYIRVGRGPRAKQCAFWAHYLPKLLQSFDKYQCRAPDASSPAQSQPPRIHPFTSSLSATNHHLKSNQQHILLPQLTSSALLIGLIVILILLAFGGALFMVATKRSWKLNNLWTLSGAPSASNGGAGATGSQTAGASGQNRSGGGNTNN